MPSSSASVAATLDVAPLLGRVARAIGSESLGGRRADAIRRHPVDQLGRLAALREANRTEVSLHELRHDP
jgi:hypothetical protein